MNETTWYDDDHDITLAMDHTTMNLDERTLAIFETTPDTDETTLNIDQTTTFVRSTTLEAVYLERNIRVSAVTEVQMITMMIGLIGMLGNGFVIVVFMTSKSLRPNITNKFLMNQSVIDLLAAFLMLASLPIKFEQELYGIGGYIICVFWNSSVLVWTALLCSTFNLVALSLEKWLKVTKPLFHKAHFTDTIGYIMMAIVWITGIVFQIALFAGTSNIKDGKCYSMAFWASDMARKVFGVITYIVKLFAPVLIICYCYISMLCSLRNTLSQTSAGNTGKQRTARAQKNILKTLIIVVVFFILCITWNQTMFLLKNLDLMTLDYQGVNYNMSVVAYFVNCCINPFIYLFKYKDFQKALRAMICKNRVGFFGSNDKSAITTGVTKSSIADGSNVVSNTQVHEDSQDEKQSSNCQSQMNQLEVPQK